jgi:NADH:ubiquinone oxidoreductase subunit 2 (subunit N)
MNSLQEMPDAHLRRAIVALDSLIDGEAAVAALIAWEVMSLGGGVMILGERITDQRGGPVLFMLALLEVGAIAILLALRLKGTHAGSFPFAGLAAAHGWHSPASLLIALLLLFGFGAKLGVLPFYEWFPPANGAGSGATGVVFSGIVLNAAFYALARGCSYGCHDPGHGSSASPLSRPSLESSARSWPSSMRFRRKIGGAC